MLIEKGHNTQNELLEEIQSVCAMLTLCIYNRCVGWVVNIQYIMAPGYRTIFCWLSISRSLFSNLGPIDCRPHADKSVQEKWS